MAIKRRSKYGAKKTTIDGITFDSKREAEYYADLKLSKRSGEIRDFKLQPVFILLENQKVEGKTVRGIKYIADFEITHNDGTLEIVDVKGFETKDFKIKKKLFYSKYPHLKLTLIS